MKVVTEGTTLFHVYQIEKFEILFHKHLLHYEYFSDESLFSSEKHFPPKKVSGLKKLCWLQALKIT